MNLDSHDRHRAELRAELGRQMRPRYKVAAEVGIHPVRFGRMLNGKEPLLDWVYASTCLALRMLPQAPTETA